MSPHLLRPLPRFTLWGQREPWKWAKQVGGHLWRVSGDIGDIWYRDANHGGGLRGKLVCFSPTDLHNPIWSSAADERFGLGPYLVINKHLFVFKDDGELYVYEIQSKAMKLLKKQRVMDGVDAWGPMAYADGMLVLRDAHTVKCLKIV